MLKRISVQMLQPENIPDLSMHCTQIARGLRGDPRHEIMGITEPHMAPIPTYEFSKKSNSGKLHQRIKIQGATQ